MFIVVIELINFEERIFNFLKIFLMKMKSILATTRKFNIKIVIKNVTLNLKEKIRK